MNTHYINRIKDTILAGYTQEQCVKTIKDNLKLLIEEAPEKSETLAALENIDAAFSAIMDMYLLPSMISTGPNNISLIHKPTGNEIHFGEYQGFNISLHKGNIMYRAMSGLSLSELLIHVATWSRTGYLGK